jgi:inhibitor of cysteine peptidase
MREKSMNSFTLTQEDKGKTFDIEMGDSLTLRLDETPTTGYVWAVDGNGDILMLQQSDFAPASAAVGSGGRRIFSFLAQKAGDVTLRLKLWREWEGDSSIVDAFTIGIRVKAR